MRNLLFVMIVVFCMSCNSDDNDQVVVATSIDLSVKNVEGTDLLNPNNTNAYKEKDIKLFYKKDGKESEYFNAILDHPKGFLIYEYENLFRIRIFPNTNDFEEFPVTYIKWNDTDTDTLKCSIKRTNASTILKKVWYNNTVIWEGNSERYFEIKK